MHEIKVESLSLEEAEHGDGGPLVIGVRSLTAALAEVDRLLTNH